MFHMKRNDFIRALQDFTQVIAIRPRHAWGYVLRSQARSRSGDLANALDDTNRAVEIHRRNHLAYRYRSSVRRKLGDTRGAVDDLSRAIEIEPSRRDLYLERGIDRRELNALEGALSDLEKAIALAEPGRRYEKAAAECVAKSRAHRGLIRLAQGRGAEAQADFDEAIRIDPSLEGWLRAEIQKAKER
jgi:tetratricopeptide (TPR) repeat protein